MSLRSEVIRIFNELIGQAKKISDLPDLPSAVDNADLFEVSRGGTSYKGLGSQLPSGSGAQDLQSVLDEGATASIATPVSLTVVDGATTNIIESDEDGITLSSEDGADQMGIDVGPTSIGIGGGGSGITITPTSVTTQTPALNDDSTKIATTAFVRDEIASRAPKVIQLAASDETTALTTGTKVTFRMPYAMTVTAVRASLTTAQASGNIFTVDIHESGTTILSTKITIDNGEETSTTAATPPVISDAALADDAEITIDIDQIGNGTAAGLKVSIIGT